MNRTAFDRDPDLRDATGAWYVLRAGEGDIASELSGTAIGLFHKVDLARSRPMPVYAVHVMPGGRADIAVGMWPEGTPDTVSHMVKLHGHHTGHGNSIPTPEHDRAIRGFASAMNLVYKPNYLGRQLREKEEALRSASGGELFASPQDLVDRGYVFRVIAGRNDDFEVLLSDGESINVTREGSSFFRYEWSESMTPGEAVRDLILADMPDAALEGMLYRINVQAEFWLHDTISRQRMRDDLLAESGMRSRLYMSGNGFSAGIEGGQDAGPFDTRREAIHAALCHLRTMVPAHMEPGVNLLARPVAPWSEPEDAPEEDEPEYPGAR